MKIGPRYKIARRLGPAVFDKTQTQKFTLSASRKGATKKRRPMGGGSQFGIQLLEKQRARFTYGINERQFSKYVGMALLGKKGNPTNSLYEILESRLDNVVYRIGLANSRQAARQMVTHGHIMVGDSRVDIPSYRLSIGDKIKIRPGSINKQLFADLETKIKERPVVSWISYDKNKKEWSITGMPKYSSTESHFDLSAVLEFYSR